MSININFLAVAVVFMCFIEHRRKKIFKSKNICPNLTIAIVACNRYNYLNRTLVSLFHHIIIYEKDLSYTLLFLDSGTIEREEVIEKYKFNNVFLFNPSGYAFSFNILFSYLYTKYVFLLEEDWVIEKNIEKEIFHPSFLLESIYILSQVSKIYGITVKDDTHFNIYENMTVRTKMGNHIVYVGIFNNNYAFANAVTTYKTKVLKEVDVYIGEKEASNIILKKGYKLGFTYKGRKGWENDIHCQHLMDHIGFKSTRSRTCTMRLY